MFSTDTIAQLAGNVPAAWRQAGGISKVRTRANDDVTCSLSDEPTPPLAPNRLLAVVLFIHFF